jgi:peptidoglycan hydrolase-like protein with peptidoglycan-binding domain
MTVTVVTRAQWGARFAIPGGRHVAPAARRWFVVHWPGGTAGTDERQNVRNIENFHRASLGWQAAPGYNFLIGRSGTIFEGAGRDVRGIHSPPRNTDGWGVCVLISPGETPPQAALNACRALYNHLNAVSGRTLGMSWHGQHFATACAGPDLNRWVQQGMPATGSPAAPAPPGSGSTAPPAAGSFPRLTTDFLSQRHNRFHPQVRVYQQRMRERGWGEMRVTGEYGPITERVTRQFQRNFGLRVTGDVGPVTWEAAFTRPVR